VLRDLQDARRLREKAGELAGLVLEYRAAHPDRPVYLLGHSGGAGVALAAAEMLPPGSLERIVLLSAAVSPCYDLTPAFPALRCRAGARRLECPCCAPPETADAPPADAARRRAGARADRLVPPPDRTDRQGHRRPERGRRTAADGPVQPRPRPAGRRAGPGQ